MVVPNRRPTIVVLGGINIDLISIVNRIPSPGETISGEEFYTSPGGKGANQAVAAAKMGANVRMVGRVGNDIFGPILLETLKGYGIDTSGVYTDNDAASGIAVILLNSQRENQIIAIYGANMRCDAKQISAAKLALEGADALLLQLEIPLETSLAVAREAQRRGILVIWDPAPVRQMPPEAYTLTDIITPNQSEAESLTGIAVTNVVSARDAALALQAQGAQTVVLKMGSEGIYHLSGETHGHIAAHCVNVVDTVAAGDAFTGALSVYLTEGLSLETAVRLGTAAGALAVTKKGAQEAMSNREEIELMDTLREECRVTKDMM